LVFWCPFFLDAKRPNGDAKCLAALTQAVSLAA
jgi:hypothetical protein